MPQFDFFSFFVQIFWLSFFNCIFYLIYLKLPLTHSAHAIKMRTKLKRFTLRSKSKIKKSYLYNICSKFFL